MAFRREKAACALVVAGLLAGPAAVAQELRYKVRHDHWRKGGQGSLAVGVSGISFQEAGSGKHAWAWRWEDIQQLTLAPRRLTVLTYMDNKWRLGADREYRFDLLSGDTFADAYDALKGKLDQRLVAALREPAREALWRIPAKHLLRFGGTQGDLVARGDGLAFESGRERESRTWRWQDIDNVSTSGPFQLTVTTYERARSHYGSLKGFNFQLKEPLEAARYDDLWRRVNASKGIPILQSYERTNNHE